MPSFSWHLFVFRFGICVSIWRETERERKMRRRIQNTLSFEWLKCKRLILYHVQWLSAPKKKNNPYLSRWVKGPKAEIEANEKTIIEFSLKEWKFKFVCADFVSWVGWGWLGFRTDTSLVNHFKHLFLIWDFSTVFFNWNRFKVECKMQILRKNKAKNVSVEYAETMCFDKTITQHNHWRWTIYILALFIYSL